jgi:TPP-dependent pyruvate/acetoin dehydrogenase alpha subunit
VRIAVSDCSTPERDADDVVRVLDSDGSVRDGVTVPAISDEELVAFYEEMWDARHLDENPS